jgi:hypothetical protein
MRCFCVFISPKDVNLPRYPVHLLHLVNHQGGRSQRMATSRISILNLSNTDRSNIPTLLFNGGEFFL